MQPLCLEFKKFQSFILDKCCGSFNKFNTFNIFLQSLDSSLFFRKLIFVQSLRSN